MLPKLACGQKAIVTGQNVEATDSGSERATDSGSDVLGAIPVFQLAPGSASVEDKPSQSRHTAAVSLAEAKAAWKAKHDTPEAMAAWKARHDTPEAKAAGKARHDTSEETNCDPIDSSEPLDNQTFRVTSPSARCLLGCTLETGCVCRHPITSSVPLPLRNPIPSTV